MTKIKNSEVQEIIETLQGTCDTLSGAIQEVTGNDDLDEDSLTEDQCKEIDGEIFLCGECNWWCETVERADDDEQICTDCYDAVN